MKELEQLGEAIRTLAADLHAATCRWLEMVADFDARSGWAEPGFKSCAHWLSWHCGLSPVAAREHVRVARRLRELPLIRASFGRGELSYSKVRALTRMENVRHEYELLTFARHADASRLERTVRAYRSATAVARDPNATQERRFLEWSWDDDGSLVLRGRFPADDGALIVEAIEALQARTERERSAAASAEAADRGGSVGASAEAPGVAAAGGAASHADGASVEAPDDPAVEVEPFPREHPRAARADALVALAEGRLTAEQAAAGSVADRFQVVLHVDAEGLRDGPGQGRCELDEGAPISAETAKRLCCDASLVAMTERDGRPLSVGRRTRSIPPALRRALRARDRGCRFPGCHHTRGLHAHHIEHWAHGGQTSLDNLVHLCRFHHRLVHEGGHRVERLRGQIVFRTPAGRRISPRPPRMRGDCDRMIAIQRSSGIETTPNSCRPLSHDHFDLDMCVDALVHWAPPEEAPAI